MSLYLANSCMAFFPPKPRNRGKTRQALSVEYRWVPSDAISVSFLDGSEKLRDRVREVARGWTGPDRAHLTLDFRKDTLATDVRVSFVLGGSWSVIGTSCRDVPGGVATMNFGWIDEDSAEDVLRAVVLHEFGHAIGLLHEHQIPHNGIQWNKPVVYAEMALEGWSAEKVDDNIFGEIEEASVDATPVDPASIMMYPIKSSWTLDGFEVGWNAELSPGDLAFVRKHYQQ